MYNRIPVTENKDYIKLDGSAWCGKNIVIPLSTNAIKIFERLLVLCDELSSEIGEREYSKTLDGKHRILWSDKLSAEKNTINGIIERMRNDTALFTIAKLNHIASSTQTEPVTRFSVTTAEMVSIEPTIQTEPETPSIKRYHWNL